MKSIKKIIKGIKLEDVQIVLNDSIVLIFKIDKYNVSLIIEKKSNNLKYYFLKSNIWYNLRIKDNNNIVYNINNVERRSILIINKNIQLLSLLDSLYKKVI